MCFLELRRAERGNKRQVKGPERAEFNRHTKNFLLDFLIQQDLCVPCKKFVSAEAVGREINKNSNY